MNDEEIFRDLKQIGCCSRCCLRLIFKNEKRFEDPEGTLESLLPVTAEPLVNKKPRPNPCVACLGLLEDRFIDELAEHSCWDVVKRYGTETFRLNLSIPGNLLIREKAVRVYLKRKFPEFYQIHNLGGASMLLSDVFKLASLSKLEARTGKIVETESIVVIGIEIEHDDDLQERDALMPLLGERVHTNLSRVQYKEIVGKNSIKTILSTFKEEDSVECFKIPPGYSSSYVKVKCVNFEFMPLMLGGRICRYSKDEVFILDKQLIYDSIHQVFGFKQKGMNMMAAEVSNDKRILGRGSPFYIKISVDEGYSGKLEEHNFRLLERLINESKSISVFDFQEVGRDAMKIIQLGSEMKKRTYNVLCVLRNTNRSTEEVIEDINKQGCQMHYVNQAVNLRAVRFDSEYKIRKKQVFMMKASEVPGHGNLFVLLLVAQAGLQVAEFVHGDFRRTRPSLSDLVQCEIDVFTVDVLDIDLDWPGRINSEHNPEVVKLLCQDQVNTPRAKEQTDFVGHESQ